MAEAMISMVILLVVLLGLMQAVILAGSVSVKNELRDEAVKIAFAELEATRNKDFASITPCLTCTSTNTVTKQFQKMNMNYGIAKTITNYTDSSVVALTLTWSFKGENMSYAVSTVVTK
ncbi:MAG: hypothetical protein HQL01_08585 [Nitrospirae bacterium]|nr:hypothetical protein [Nitrospirota bacterium]